MDFVSEYKKKLASFRLKELKDILGRLGLAKQGRKQDLVDKIIALLSCEASNVHGLTKKKFSSKEEVAGVIDDVYRKLQGAGPNSSPVDGGSSLQVNNMRLNAVEVPVHLDNRICCPCGSSFPNEHMIQCTDRQCCVLQHAGCVIVPEECSDVTPPIPSQFYCQICRINRSDPFWVTMAQPLFPVKLITSNIATDSTNPLQFVEKSFDLTRADRELIENMDCDVQAWCVLLNDKVPFRMQWPLYSDLKVNGVPVRTVNRPGSQLLGANGRDDGPRIAFYLSEGVNHISLTGCDARSFCLGIRLVKQRTVEEIINMILKEQNRESFEDALARVRRCVGGKMAMADEDSDSDLEVIADCVTVNLRCPMSSSRIKTAGRFRPCAHMACFDVETFVQLNQRSRKWQCPICMKNYSLEDITIDHYFNHIAKMMQDCGEDIVEIEVRPDGSWRVKNGYQFKNLGDWHLPDGSVCVSTIEPVSNLDTSELLKEGASMGFINPKEESISYDFQTLSRNRVGEYFENNVQNVTVSRGSSESHREGRDCSIYQDHMMNIDIPVSNVVLYDSHAAAGAINENTSASFGDLDVIVLSDSEEDNANLLYTGPFSMTPAVNNGEHCFSAPPGLSDIDFEDPVFSAGMGYGNEFEMSHQAFASSGQDGSPCQQLYTENASGYPPVTSSALGDGEALTSECTIDLGRQSDLGNNPQTPNGICQENLTSLGLDSNCDGANCSAPFHAKPATSNGLDMVNQFVPNEVSLPLRMKDESRSIGTTDGKRSGPFSFPRRPRSARRPYIL